MDVPGIGIVGSFIGKSEGETLGSEEGITLGALVGPVARIPLAVKMSISLEKPISPLRFSPSGKNSDSRVTTYKFSSFPRSSKFILTFTKLQLRMPEAVEQTPS